MSKHIIIDQVWVQNRYRKRKRMTGKKLYLDFDSGFMVSSTSGGFTVEKKRTFLTRFELCSNIWQIAKSVEIDIQTFYDHLALDTKFREEYNRLNEIEGKEKQLNNALLEVKEEQRIAFIADMMSKTKNYL